MANNRILRSRNYATLYLKIYSKNFSETWSLSGCYEKRKMPYFEKTIFQKIPLWCKWSIQAQFWAKVKEISASVSALRIFLNFCIMKYNKGQTKRLQLKFPKKSSIQGKYTISAGFGPTLWKFNISGSTLRTFFKLCQFMSWTLNFRLNQERKPGIGFWDS